MLTCLVVIGIYDNRVTSTMHVTIFRYILRGPNQLWAQGPNRLKCGPEGIEDIQYVRRFCADDPAFQSHIDLASY